jgi:hypothetical protein
MENRIRVNKTLKRKKRKRTKEDSKTPTTHSAFLTEDLIMKYVQKEHQSDEMTIKVLHLGYETA